MFAQIEYPARLQSEELDKYLEMGWFRMRQTIFTTNFLHFNKRFYSAIWLRVALDSSIYDKRYQKLSKLNKGFRTEIKKLGNRRVSKQQELLYEAYRAGISFEVSPSLQELLIGSQAYNRFNTYEINIYDGSNLIATGFFDLGKISAAGITCIYDPQYKKFSLGKYLMYLKMDFCKQQHLEYFYPGYVVPGYTPFDYKLEIGQTSLQYLQLSTQQWLPYSPQVPVPDPLQEMLKKLIALHYHLTTKKIHNAVFYYKYFEANLDPYYNGNDLFDYPVFLLCFPATDALYYSMVVYDVADAKYLLLQCSSFINIGLQHDSNIFFESDLLKVESILFATAAPEQMGDHLAGFL